MFYTEADGIQAILIIRSVESIRVFDCHLVIIS